MATYTCEEPSICKKFQSAICLHCNFRLCLEHITEHNKIIYSNITNLSKDVQLTYQEIQDESKKRKDIFNNILISFNQWKIEQIDKIQQIYNKHLELIEYQRDTLNKAELILFEKLEQNALQPIELVKQQQNASMDIINHIKQTIQKVREDNAYLKWKLSIPPPPVEVQFTSLNIPSISIPDETSKSSKKRKISSTNTNKQPPNGHALQRLVTMFSNITSIEQSKKDIHAYVKASQKSMKRPNFVCSYLTAWYRKTKLNEKVYLLNEHIKTVQEILGQHSTDLDVVLGIQVFFYNENIKEDKNEMMTFLLQFFLNHHLINEKGLCKWYYDIKKSRYEGLNQAKQLAKSFIESISSMPSIDSARTVSIESTPFGQSFSIEIKQETTSINQ